MTEQTYLDLGYNQYIERPLLPQAELFSGASLNSAVEPYSITEEMIDPLLIARLES